LILLIGVILSDLSGETDATTPAFRYVVIYVILSCFALARPSSAIVQSFILLYSATSYVSLFFVDFFFLGDDR